MRTYHHQTVIVPYLHHVDDHIPKRVRPFQRPNRIIAIQQISAVKPRARANEILVRGIIPSWINRCPENRRAISTSVAILFQISANAFPGGSAISCSKNAFYTIIRKGRDPFMPIKMGSVTFTWVKRRSLKTPM